MTRLFQNRTNAIATLTGPQTKSNGIRATFGEGATAYNKMFMPAWGSVLLSSFVFLISFSNAGQLRASKININVSGNPAGGYKKVNLLICH